VNNILELAPILHGPSIKIFITTHHKPDGDAMGSTLGLYHYLKKLGHQPTVVTPNDYGTFLYFLPDHQHSIQFETHALEAQKVLDEAELIFCLDFNHLSRINELGDLVRESKATKVMIDHHLHPDHFASYYLHDHHASATCELVFRLIEIMGDEALLDQKIATCLYTGIMTDTGSFRFSATTPAVHRTIARLMEAGANHVFIHEAINDSWSFERLQFVGYVLMNKLKHLPDKKTAYITISAEELERFKVKTGDTEGIVNYALSIEGVKFAALIVDRTILVKMSFRSKGAIPANQFSNSYFNGGGHLNAAGGQSSDPLDITEARFLAALDEFTPQILNDHATI
jgi:phosphoesterase RecJ-like protein